ncbi:MAG TPA: hypothetical protein VFD51_01905 [Patescibacteria group bacterium]|nr:hypothetical protein [Patescibacteria group bacterium]
MNWNDVEKQINIEVNFLKNNLDLSPFTQNDAINCNDCLFRLISILIVSGKIKVEKVFVNNSFFGKENDSITDQKRHGSHWHSNKMLSIKKYLKIHNLVTVDEKKLLYGRSDLYIAKKNIFIEIGTINLYKLYVNLLNMQDARIIVIPSDNYILDFKL